MASLSHLSLWRSLEIEIVAFEMISSGAQAVAETGLPSRGYQSSIVLRGKPEAILLLFEGPEVEMANR